MKLLCKIFGHHWQYLDPLKPQEKMNDGSSLLLVKCLHCDQEGLRALREYDVGRGIELTRKQLNGSIHKLKVEK